MSIASYAVSDAAIGAQAGAPITVKKPPPKRTTVALADIDLSPEPR